MAEFPVGEFPIGIPSRAQGYISTKTFQEWRCPWKTENTQGEKEAAVIYRVFLQKQVRGPSSVLVVTRRAPPGLSGCILVYHGEVQSRAGSRPHCQGMFCCISNHTPYRGIPEYNDASIVSALLLLWSGLSKENEEGWGNFFFLIYIYKYIYME